MTQGGPPSESFLHRHRWALRVGLAGTAVVLTLVVVEVFLPNPAELPANRFIRLKEHPPHLHLEQHLRDPEAGKDGDPGIRFRIDTDEYGFLEHEPRLEEPDWEVVFLGGSTTECKIQAPHDRWPAVVRIELERRFRLRVNTYNGGLGGNDVMHSNLALVSKVLPMEPDMVVLMHGVNDLFVMGVTGTYWHDLPSRSLVTSAPAPSDGYLFFQGLANLTFPGIAHAVVSAMPERRDRMRERMGVPVAGRDEFATYRDAGQSATAAHIRSSFRSSVTQFVTTAQAWNVQPVLMTQANRHIVPPPEDLARDVDKLTGSLNMDYEAFAGLHQDLNDILRDVATEYDLVLVDLAAVIEPEPELISDGVHLTPYGSLLAAEEISQILGPVILDALGREAPPPENAADWSVQPLPPE